jgi:hypothetical protein
MKASGLALLAAIGVVAANTALANGFLENRPWQFDTPADKIAKIGIQDLIQRKKGGYYDAFKTTVNNNNAFTTNVYGDQVNCNLSASAVGNVGTNSMDAVTSSPTGVGDSDIFADATGNVSTNSNAANDPDGGSVSNTQSNSSSPQTASADGSSIGSNIGTQTVSGTSTQGLTSDQQNFDSPINANITDSAACNNP